MDDQIMAETRRLGQNGEFGTMTTKRPLTYEACWNCGRYYQKGEENWVFCPRCTDKRGKPTERYCWRKCRRCRKCKHVYPKEERELKVCPVCGECRYCIRFKPVGLKTCGLHGSGYKSKGTAQNLKHGIVRLPEAIAPKILEAMADPDLLNLRRDVAVAGEMVNEQIEEWVEKSGAAAGWVEELIKARDKVLEAQGEDSKAAKRRAGVWMGRILKLIETGAEELQARRGVAELQDHKRKLVEAEVRREKQMQLTVSLEAFVLLAAEVFKSLKRHVYRFADPEAAARVTQKVSGDLYELMGGRDVDADGWSVILGKNEETEGGE